MVASDVSRGYSSEPGSQHLENGPGKSVGAQHTQAQAADEAMSPRAPAQPGAVACKTEPAPQLARPAQPQAQPPQQRTPPRATEPRPPASAANGLGLTRLHAPNSTAAHMLPPPAHNHSPPGHPSPSAAAGDQNSARCEVVSMHDVSRVVNKRKN
jgi:hypothetical protein